MQEYDAFFKRRMEEYQRDFDLTGINNSNDLATLQMLIRLEAVINQVQQRLDEVIGSGDPLENAADIKKLSDVIRDYAGIFQQLQQTLAIDRRSRKSDNASSVKEYIDDLLIAAKAFYEEKITRLYCPKCEVMVGRFAPVHDHTAYEVTFYCSQCTNPVTVRRDGRDRLADLPEDERTWRSKYQAKITSLHPSLNNTQEDDKTTAKPSVTGTPSMITLGEGLETREITFSVGNGAEEFLDDISTATDKDTGDIKEDNIEKSDTEKSDTEKD